MKGEKGFTLIELLVALAVLAVLAVIGTRGLTAVLESQARVGAEERRWNDLSLALSQVAHDLSLAVSRPEAADESALLITRLGEDVVGRRGARRVGYRLRAGSIEYLAWAPSQPATSAPEVHRLLDGVATLKWRSLDDAGNWVPVAAAPTSVLPRALELDLALTGGDRIVRIFALR